MILVHIWTTTWAPMFKWPKKKAEKDAANECRLNIEHDVRILVAIANHVNECIDLTGWARSSDIEVISVNQRRFLDDITLGLSNRLSLTDIEGAIGEALARETVSTGARMAIDHILNHVRSGTRVSKLKLH